MSETVSSPVEETVASREMGEDDVVTLDTHQLHVELLHLSVGHVSAT